MRRQRAAAPYAIRGLRAQFVVRLAAGASCSMKSACDHIVFRGAYRFIEGEPKMDALLPGCRSRRGMAASAHMNGSKQVRRVAPFTSSTREAIRPITP